MKDGLKYIIGKTITSVVFAENNSPPQNQVFLVFSDGTSFEFYGENFSCASGVDRGGVEEARGYAEKGGARIRAVYPLSKTA